MTREPTTSEEKLNLETAAEVGTACHTMLEELLSTGSLLYSVGGVVKVITQNDGSEHSRLSPSGAERWTACPGSVVLVPKLVESQPRITDVKVTKEMLEWVHTAADWVLGYLRANPDCILYTEERARAGAFFGCPDDMWGTSDVVILNRRKLELVVVDGKFGWVEVEAEENKQLTIYAGGIAHDFGWAFSTVRMVILQPRCEEDPVKQWVISQDRLLEEMRRLQPKVDRALAQWSLPKNKLELHATDEGCKWCEAAPLCPELQKRSLELAKREFSDPALLDKETFMRILDSAEQIRDALNKVERHALNLLALGQEVPGFKRVRGIKRRVWKDPTQGGETLVKLGVPRDEVWRTELQFTPTQAEKRVGKNFVDLLESYIDQPVGEPTLVREDDKRFPLAPDFAPC